jgi:polyhydroxyalkanoate synthase
LKPREEGKVDYGIPDQVTEAIKSLGGVAEYWLADPKRVVEMQASAGHTLDRTRPKIEIGAAEGRQKAEFYVRQIANAISPSNFVLTCPALMSSLSMRIPRTRFSALDDTVARSSSP